MLVLLLPGLLRAQATHTATHLMVPFLDCEPVIAGSAFFIITVVVLICGIGDLKGMFARLRASGKLDDFGHKERLDPHS